MDVAKQSDSQIESGIEFYEALATPFSIAAESAVWMVQYILPNANAEVIGRLNCLVPIVERVTRANFNIINDRDAGFSMRRATPLYEFCLWKMDPSLGITETGSKSVGHRAGAPIGVK